MCFPPQGDRNNWYFVTHGLSQPPMDEDSLIPGALADYLDWRDVNCDEPISGWGIELVVSTRAFCQWPFDLLLKVVEYLLFSEHSQIILPGHRLPVGHPIVPAPNPLLNYLLAITSPEYPSSILLPGGSCSLVHLVGVTEAEITFARRLKNPGSLVLQSVLQKLGVGCLTNPERPCLTTHPQFKRAWKEAEDEVKNLKMMRLVLRSQIILDVRFYWK